MRFTPPAVALVLAAAIVPSSRADNGFIGTHTASSLLTGRASISSGSSVLSSAAFGPTSGPLSESDYFSLSAYAAVPTGDFCVNICAKSAAEGALYINVGQGLFTTPVSGMPPIGSYSADGVRRPPTPPG